MHTNKKVTTFKERFSDLFNESEKTATELAKELHVSNQTISAWKTGERSPKEPTVIAIAQHFGVRVEWLMGFDVEKEAKPGSAIQKPDGIPQTVEAKIISTGVDRMPKEQREKALEIFRLLFDKYADDFGGDEDDA